MSCQDNDSFKVQEFVAHSTEVTCLTFGSKSYQLMATGGEDCRVNIWRIGSTSNLWTLDKNKSAIQSLCFDNDEQYIVSGNKSGSIKIFDLNEGRLAKSLVGHQVGVNCLQYHAFGEFIVSGSSDCTMKVWDIRSKTCLQTYSGHDKAVTCVRFSPDGRWVASSSEDGNLHIWDLVAGKLLNSFQTKPGFITSFDFNPVEFMMSAVTSVRTVKIWDLDTMKPAFHIPADSNPVRAICHTQYRDGAICTATKDGVKLWSLEQSSTAKLLGSAAVGWDKIADMKITPQNKILGGSFISNFVSIWSLDLENVFTSPGPGRVKTPSRPSIAGDRNPSPQVPSVPSSAGGLPRHNSRNQILPPSRPTAGITDAKVGRQASPSFGIGNSNRNKIEEKNDISSDNKSHISRGPQIAESKFSGQSYEDYASAGVGAGIGGAKGSYSAETTLPSYDDAMRGGNGRHARVNNTAATAAIIHEAEKENGDDSDIDIDQYIEQRPMTTSTPQVKWESDNAAKEMATSMGESFWKRFQESQKTARLIKSKASAEPSVASAAVAVGDAKGNDGDDDDDEGFGEEDDDFDADEFAEEFAKIDAAIEHASRMDDIDSLNNILPASKFADVNSNNSNVKACGNDKPVLTPRSRGAAAGAGGVLPAERQYVPTDLNKLKAAQRERERERDRRPKSNASESSDINSNAAAPPAGKNVLHTPPSFEVVGSSNSSNGNVNNSNNRRGSSADGYVGHSNDDDAVLNKCYVVADKLLTTSSSFIVSMSQRLRTLKVLRRDWEKGHINEVISHLREIQESVCNDPLQLVVLSDFLSAVKFKGPSISLDCCVRVFPVLEGMISHRDGWTSSHVTITVMDTFVTLCEMFGDLIRQSRAASFISVGGVDISREERLKKCSICFDILVGVKNRLEMIKNHHKKNQAVTDAVCKFQTHLDF